MTPRLWHTPPFIWAAAIAAAALLVLAPALWNGFPFMFYDSGAYIELAVLGGFMAERSAFYGAFLSAFWPGISLWPAMVAQVLLTVLVMAGFARVVLPDLSPWRFLTLVAVISVMTGLPWYAAQVVPDIMTPLLVLSLYMLGFHTGSLNRTAKAALVAVAVLATTSHASHLGLAAGLAAVTGVLQIAMRRAALGSAAPRWGLPALAFALSLVLLLTSNFVRTGDLFVSRSGPGFLLARLIQDGIAQRLLDETCPQSGYRLCAYKDQLPRDSNDFLWGAGTPFQSLGGFESLADESRSIVVESMKRYPLMNLKAALLNTAQQFTAFDTGDSIEPLNDVPVPAMERAIPQHIDDYRASRQQNDELDFGWINALQVPIGALSIAALAAILTRATMRRQWSDRTFLPIFLLAALLGNAFICGVLSSPHDRYQSRLMWAISFAVLLLVTPGLGAVLSRIRPRPLLLGEPG